MAFIAKSYKLTCPWIIYGGNPKTWVLEGSNGSGWDTIDAQTDYFFATTTDAFTISNTTDYQKYRITVSAVYGAFGVLIKQLEILDGAGVNQCVTMTANNAPSPAVASASYEADPAYKAFDSDASSWWDSNALTGWLCYDTGVAPLSPLYPITLTYPADHAFVVSPDFFKWEIPS